MKKFILIAIILILIGCEKTEYNANENYIQLLNVTPKSGSTITNNTNIEFTVEYNISQNELEGLGFIMHFWYKSDDGTYWSYAKKYLTVRNESFDFSTKISKIQYANPQNDFYYKVSFSRITGEKTSEPLKESNELHYKISPEK